MFADFQGKSFYGAPLNIVPTRRIPRTANVPLGNGDSGSLIDITSGTFAQQIQPIGQLKKGWYAYVGNSGTGFATLTPMDKSTITVNGSARTTWVLWPREMGILLADVESATPGFYYYCIQKGEIVQTLSGSVASVSFSTGLAYRRKMSLMVEDFATNGATGPKAKLQVNGGDATRTQRLTGTQTTLTTANDTYLALSGRGMLQNATGDQRLFSTADINVGTVGMIVHVSDEDTGVDNFTSTSRSSGVWIITESTISSLTVALTTADSITAGTFILREI